MKGDLFIFLKIKGLLEQQRSLNPGEKKRGKKEKENKNPTNNNNQPKLPKPPNQKDSSTSVTMKGNYLI